jgi:elongation factor 1 alpha-like protein
MASLNLQDDEPDEHADEEPKMTLVREKVLEEARAAMEGDREGKKSVSLVVIGTHFHTSAAQSPLIFDFGISTAGHVDAGKSTLMGRLLYELGRVDEKRRTTNERASGKLGKGSFSWAWELDGTVEERERFVNKLTAEISFPSHVLSEE